MLLLFPLGASAGYLCDGAAGALWGAGGGLVLGGVAMGWFVQALRRRR